MFGSSTSSGFGGFGQGGSTFGGANQPTAQNPMKDIEVTVPPEDSISCMEFGPVVMPNGSYFLVTGAWDNNCRGWEIKQNGESAPKVQQSMTGPILDISFHNDGRKVFMASCDKMVKAWDLDANKVEQVAAHDAPIKTVNWIKGTNYECLMTGSWDKTLKFWDLRSPNPMMTIQLPERVYCADVLYPMAVVGTASRGLIIYQLDGQPKEYKKVDSPLKFQHRTVAIFKDKKTNQPSGFAVGSIEGRVAIHYANTTNPKDNFTFKCHRSNGSTAGVQDIFAVNDIAFHPDHGTLATCGSDGRFSFWDKDARTKLKTSEALDQPISACCFDPQGKIFAYAASYDWSKGHEGFDAQKKPHILMRPCYDELKPSSSKK